MSYNWGRIRNRLRKGKRGTSTYYGYGSRAIYRPIYRVGYVIAKSQDDYEKMRKYAIVIRRFQRRLNIAISDFLDIGVYGFEEDFENKEENNDSKLAVYDSWTGEKIRDTKEGGDEDEEDSNCSHDFL
jgi:hypothetical protein